MCEQAAGIPEETWSRKQQKLGKQAEPGLLCARGISGRKNMCNINRTPTCLTYMHRRLECIQSRNCTPASLTAIPTR